MPSRRIRFTFPDTNESAIAALLDEEAPRLCEMVWNLLPLEKRVLHGMYSGAEVFMVLEGSCTFDGEEMARFDLAVVEANQPYGFTAGPDGLSFLVVRQGRAAYAEASESGEAT